MKLCELKIQDYEDRMRIVAILASAGYKVSIKDYQNKSNFEHHYFVVVETGEMEAEECK